MVGISKTITDIVPGSICRLTGWAFIYDGTNAPYSEPIATVTIANGKIVSCEDQSYYDDEGHRRNHSV